MDPLYGHLRHGELFAAATEHRLARSCGRTRRPSPVLRLYTRVWWASRPRVENWPRALLGIRPDLLTRSNGTWWLFDLDRAATTFRSSAARPGWSGPIHEDPLAATVEPEPPAL